MYIKIFTNIYKKLKSFKIPAVMQCEPDQSSATGASLLNTFRGQIILAVIYILCCTNCSHFLKQISIWHVCLFVIENFNFFPSRCDWTRKNIISEEKKLQNNPEFGSPPDLPLSHDRSTRLKKIDSSCTKFSKCLGIC